MTKIASQNDLELAQILLEHGPRSIAQLEKHLGVTATAVRQRLNRMLAAGLVDRQTESEGRGRPNYVYEVTASGRKATGNNLSDFAQALWNEVQSITDEKLRKSILEGASMRLAKAYAEKIDGTSLEQKLESVAKLFGDRNVPVSVEKNTEGLPTLKILACPYPDLANDSNEVCEMERRLVSEVVGDSVDLCQCRQDGDQCCTFQVDSQNEN